jgi:hypothetical protein
LKSDRKISEASFWLSLVNSMPQYNDVHANLSPGRKWTSPTLQWIEPNDWARIESYMGPDWSEPEGTYHHEIFPL